MKDSNKHIDNIIQQKVNDHPIVFDENNWAKMEGLLDTHLPIAQTGGSVVAKTSFFKKMASFFLPVVATIGLGYLVWNANVNQTVTTDVLNAQNVPYQSLAHGNADNATGIEKTIDSSTPLAAVTKPDDLESNIQEVEKTKVITSTTSTAHQAKNLEKLVDQQKANQNLSLAKPKIRLPKQNTVAKTKDKQTTNIVNQTFTKPLATTLQNNAWANAIDKSRRTDFTIDNGQHKVLPTRPTNTTKNQGLINAIDNQYNTISTPNSFLTTADEILTTELSDKLISKKMVAPLTPQAGLVELEKPLALDGKPFPKQKWKRLHMGIVAGLNTRMLVFNNKFSMLPFGGLWFDYQIKGKYHLEVRPQYVSVDVAYSELGKNGTRFSSSFTHERFTDDRDYIIHHTTTYTLNYFQLPIIIKRQFGQKANFLFTGTHLSYLLPNRKELGGTEGSWAGAYPYLPFENKEGLQKFDVGLILGIQQTIHPKLKFDIRYTQGLFDITHDNWFKNSDIHINSDLQISFMYQIK